MSAVSKPKSQTNALLQQQIEDAEKEVSTDDPITRRANVLHLVAKRMIDMEEQAIATLRMVIWMVYKDDLYREVQVPRTNFMGKPIISEDGEIEIIRFTEFDDWFEFIVAQKSDSVKSILRNGVKVLLRAAHEGRFHKDDGTNWKAEELLPMTERNFTALVGITNKLAGENKLDEVAPYIPLALNGTQKLLVSTAKAKGHIGSRGSKIKIKRAITGDGDVLVSQILTSSEMEALEIRLGDKVEFETVTLEHLLRTMETVNAKPPVQQSLAIK